MESAIEAPRASKPKPALAPKPRLTPKPFSVQTNTTIRSINAPKRVSARSAAGKPPSQAAAKDPPTAAARKPPEQTAAAAGAPTKEQDTSTQERTAAITQAALTPKDSEPVQKDAANHKTPQEVASNPENKVAKRKDEPPTSVAQRPQEAAGDDSSSANPTFQWGGARKRLSMELTSKFESGGLTLPPQPRPTSSRAQSKADTKQPVSCHPEPAQTAAPEPPASEPADGGPTEGCAGGGSSIKRRISLLLDSTSRPEVAVTREEPDVMNATGGVKDRIKNWALETSCDDPRVKKKPQVVPRPRAKRLVSSLGPRQQDKNIVTQHENHQEGNLLIFCEAIL